MFLVKPQDKSNVQTRSQTFFQSQPLYKEGFDIALNKSRKSWSPIIDLHDDSPGWRERSALLFSLLCCKSESHDMES